MRRLAFTSAVVVCSVALATAAFAQAAKSTAAPKKDAAPAPAAAPAPPSPELMKARTRPPVKGTATVDLIQGPSKPMQSEIVNVLKVKNTSGAPIVGFRIDEYFYRQGKGVAAGSGPLPQSDRRGEDAEITVSAPNETGHHRQPDAVLAGQWRGETDVSEEIHRRQEVDRRRPTSAWPARLIHGRIRMRP